MHPAGTPDRPNVARVYDYWLGGNHWLEADRELAEAIEAELPGTAADARHARRFLGRAVRWAACRGIAQFLDLGAGLPATPAVHEAAREVTPGARVAYVEHDPVAAAYGRRILAGTAGTTAVEADLRDPAAVLAAPGLAGVIDLARPCTVILSLVLNFVPPDESVRLLRDYTRRLAPGSALIVSAGYADPETARKLSAMYGAADLRIHPREVMLSWLDGLDVVPPGLADVRGLIPGAPYAGVRWRSRGVAGAVACVC